MRDREHTAALSGQTGGCSMGARVVLARIALPLHLAIVRSLSRVCAQAQTVCNSLLHASRVNLRTIVGNPAPG